MIFGSVCSGIEAASVAWHQLGWRAAFVSEIDPFPRAVLAHHYPDVPLHGDFTTIREGDYESINVLVGGTPCQSFSIAGLRAGLDDDRGNLALEFCRLARRLEPRWVVWENVPGVLSLDGGRAFASILGGLAECGYGLAYRVLDAQFVRVDGFGRAVPQRRRRVFVVGCLGDWRCAAAVLFERHSLSRDTAPRRQAGQGAAPNLAARTRGGGGLGTDFDCDGGLVAKTVQATHKGHRDDPSADTFLPVAHALCVDGFDASEDGTGRGTPLVPGQGQPCIAFNARQDPYVFDGHTGPLDTDGSTQGIFSSWRVRRLTPRECERLQGFPDGYTRIPGASAGGWRDIDETEEVEELIALGLAVRLTGNVWRVKDPDGPRYKALGNSFAVNVVRWIGTRIQAVENISGGQS